MCAVGREGQMNALRPPAWRPGPAVHGRSDCLRERTTEPRAASVRLPRGVPRTCDRRCRAALCGDRVRGAAARLIAETPRLPSAGALRDGRPRDSGDQQPAGADVGADHRADLRDEERLAAVDLSPALDQALGLIGRPDVLDGPAAAGFTVDHLYAVSQASLGPHAACLPRRLVGAREATGEMYGDDVPPRLD